MIYVSYYGAKFARERQYQPEHWIIAVCPKGYRLAYVGPSSMDDQQTQERTRWLAEMQRNNDRAHP